MKCEQFRERLGEDPTVLDAVCAEHERICSACAAYARRWRESERLIAAALRFDVARARGASRATAPRGRLWAAAAAIAFAATALWLAVRFVPTDDPVRLARAVQDHWRHEPQSWEQSTTPVAMSVLEAALGGEAEIDLAERHVVSYARSCLVNGRWVPHLVVQGQAGPVMVLLLSRESLPLPQPLDMPAEGLRGLILPLGEGSIAILGEDDEPLEDVQQELIRAVEWTT